VAQGPGHLYALDLYPLVRKVERAVLVPELRLLIEALELGDAGVSVSPSHFIACHV
jgi:hypothetical protein